jgi:hypothetical protein
LDIGRLEGGGGSVSLDEKVELEEVPIGRETAAGASEG